jgi:hypothetical protein
MTQDPNIRFDVIGAGYVSEHHSDGTHSHLPQTDGAAGIASVWLAFYAIAAVVVVVSNLHAVAGFVVAAH